MSTEHLPEAPASVNLRLMVRGYEVQLTLRDWDEAELSKRLHRVLDQLAVDERQAQGKAAMLEEPPLLEEEPDDIPEPGTREEWCAFHHAQMRPGKWGPFHLVGPGQYCNGHWCEKDQQEFRKRRGKNGTFYSHERADGSWCYEKPAKVGSREPGEES